MNGTLRSLWERLTGSLWFVPGLIVLAAIALAVGAIAIDDSFGEELDLAEKLPRFFGANAEGSRAMLGNIATAMATIAGVTFSITVVAVAQAANQYTPRILRSFMRDRGNQATLGSFIGIFVYALIVMRTLRGQDDLTFVPSIAILLAFALVIVGMGLLIYFIHHITDSLQASTVLRKIQEETCEAIAHLFPDDLGDAIDPDEPTDRTESALQSRRWAPIMAERSGYLQSVDHDGLLQLASELDTIVKMEQPIGAFIVCNTPLASVSAPVAADQRISRRVNRLFVINSNRTVSQDVAYGLRELVDIAVKAASPSVNDIGTTITAIDYLGATLTQIAQRKFPSWLREHEGELRVIARAPTFPMLVDDALLDIRRNAGPQTSIWLRLITMLRVAASATHNRARRELLVSQIREVAGEAERAIHNLADRDRLRRLASQPLD